MDIRALFGMIMICIAFQIPAQTIISLSFTATFNGNHQPLDSIRVDNLSQGGDTVLYGIDTVLVLEETIGTRNMTSLSTTGLKLSALHPNPSEGPVRFKLFLPSGERVMLRLSGLDGKQAILFSQTLPAGEHTFELHPGNNRYCFITAETATEREVMKFIHLGEATGEARILLCGSSPAGHPQQRIGNSFPWKPGDSLKFTGYFMNLFKVVITDNPGVSQPYTFEMIIGQPCPGIATVTDFNGNVYSTVQIGNQCWMKENLRTRNLNNGSAIPNITNGSSWGSTYSSARCWYNNDSATHAGIYGSLYNWYATQTGMLCPTGWHVPSENDWDELTDLMGGLSIAGGALKATSYWNTPNTGATNFSGFTALPGGFREFIQGGQFLSKNIIGLYWSSTEESLLYGRLRKFAHDSGQVESTYNPKTYGHSVRCIKD